MIPHLRFLTLETDLNKNCTRCGWQRKLVLVFVIRGRRGPIEHPSSSLLDTDHNARVKALLDGISFCLLNSKYRLYSLISVFLLILPIKLMLTPPNLLLEILIVQKRLPPLLRRQHTPHPIHRRPHSPLVRFQFPQRRG